VTGRASFIYFAPFGRTRGLVCNDRANIFTIKLRATADFSGQAWSICPSFRLDFDLSTETLFRYEPKRWRKGLQPRLEFFFDCASPWTYLAFERLMKRADRVSCDLVWKPVLVGGVFNKVNDDVYKQRAAPNPVKAAYYQKDLRDWARHSGVVINQPSIFPVRSVTAMRGCFYAIAHARIEAYARALFEAYWRDDRDIGREDIISDCADQAGLDGVCLLAAAKDTSAKEALIATTDELIARGGFGSPTFFINGDDMYFGNDRLELVEMALQELGFSSTPMRE
jgi:2-hydroxychromene-2-carboxylate isomerase